MGTGMMYSGSRKEIPKTATSRAWEGWAARLMRLSGMRLYKAINIRLRKNITRCMFKRIIAAIWRAK
jgi:hypothetical protein